MATKKKTTKEAEKREIYSGPSSILITGAAGYVGAMLCNEFSENPFLKEIIAIDKEDTPDFLKDNKKINWIKSELSTGDWIKIAEEKKPEVVIHTAWQIKELYDDKELQRKLNVEASEKVFDFVFNSSFVKKLIYFSTISAYGAFDNNKKDNLFEEGDMLRENEYLYGDEKREVEMMLAKKFSEIGRQKKIFVLRPTTIMGPRAKYMTGKKGLLYMIEKTLPFLPIANDDWGRQYVHEDDVTNIVAMFTFNNVPGRYEVFNLAPKDIVLGKDLAKIFNKETFWIPPLFIRIAFFFAWHFSQGKVPTGAGAWKFFCYPIYVNGEKITKKLKYPYLYSSFDALIKDEGRYDFAVPPKEKPIEEAVKEDKKE